MLALGVIPVLCKGDPLEKKKPMGVGTGMSFLSNNVQSSSKNSYQYRQRTQAKRLHSRFAFFLDSFSAQAILGKGCFVSFQTDPNFRKEGGVFALGINVFRRENL